MRVPKAVADERRRRLREDARKRQRPPSAAVLALADWTILLTNVPPELLGAQETFVVMRARWQIEKLFELWKKRHGRLGKTRSGKPWRILCEVHAKLLGLLVQHWVFLTGVAFWAGPYRSPVKGARTVRQRALALADALDDPARLCGVIEVIGRCLAVGCRVAKRRKEPGTAQQLLALTGGGKEGTVA